MWSMTKSLQGVDRHWPIPDVRDRLFRKLLRKPGDDGVCCEVVGWMMEEPEGKTDGKAGGGMAF